MGRPVDFYKCPVEDFFDFQLALGPRRIDILADCYQPAEKKATMNIARFTTPFKEVNCMT